MRTEPSYEEIAPCQDLVIRDARPEDAEQLLAVLNPIIEARAFTALDTPFTLDEERAFIASVPPRGIFLVAVSAPERRIVGMQSLEPFARDTHAFDHVGVTSTSKIDGRYVDEVVIERFL